MDDTAIIKITAILALAAICCAALLKGVDSVIVSVISAVIGGVAGYEMKKKRGS